jgi:hypothetical protein
MNLIKLENFLDKFDNNEIYNEDLYYEKFGYDNNGVFENHINFLLENCYNIKVKTDKKMRLNQKNFRKLLLEKYNGKCIVSDNDCIHELKAAHIVPIADEESYDIDNGLLLTSTLHDTMDKLLWAINPQTLIIEVNKNHNVGQIKNYIGNKVNIVLNEYIKNNLQIQYDKFIKNLNTI